jgi:serine-aspartate repeat-containing protein C/D/E
MATATRVPPTATPRPTNTPAPQLGSIGDRVWNDFNRNSIQDAGEPGVGGVTVQLKDCSGNVLQNTTTNNSGLYRFNNLSTGCYTIGVILPNGFVYSLFKQGANNNLDSDIRVRTGMSDNINLNPGQNLDIVDAALFVEQGGGDLCIGDFVWRDNNINGLQDAGELGFDGLEIYLGVDTNGDGRIDRYVGNTVTANGGKCQFCGLDSTLTYTVEFISPGFCGFTLPNVGTNDTIDSDPDISKGLVQNVTVNPGQSNFTIDAGLVCHD